MKMVRHQAESDKLYISIFKLLNLTLDIQFWILQKFFKNTVRIFEFHGRLEKQNQKQKTFFISVIKKYWLL